MLIHLKFRLLFLYENLSYYKLYRFLMKKNEILYTISRPILEAIVIVVVFFIAYNLRSQRDWIPGVELTMPYISIGNFLPFVIVGVIFWFIIFTEWGLYKIRLDTPFSEEIRLTLTRALLWFLLYIGFVYLTTGFLLRKRFPDWLSFMYSSFPLSEL